MGPPAKMADLLGLTIVFGVAVIVFERWSLGIVLIVALILDATLSEGRRDRFIFAGLMVGAIAVTWVIAEATTGLVSADREIHLIPPVVQIVDQVDLRYASTTLQDVKTKV